MKSLNAAERAAYPFPGLRRFGEQRVGQLLPDYEVLKDAGNTDTVEFRNLQTRISHLISNVNSALRDQILAEHSADGMQVLGGNPSFTWGNKEEYRGTINEELNIDAAQSPLLAYFSHFESFQFLCVFFNFHTDEDRGGCYGSVDPSSPPPVLG